MLPGAVAAFLLVHGQARCADGRQFEAEIREYRVCYVYFMKVWWSRESRTSRSQ
jgi:hypothetical protein